MKKALCILLTSFVLTLFVNGQNFDSSNDIEIPGFQSREQYKIKGLRVVQFTQDGGKIDQYFPIQIFKDSTTKVGYDMISDKVMCEGDYLYAIKEMSLFIYELMIKNDSLKKQLHILKIEK